jgi:hypothetical protein
MKLVLVRHLVKMHSGRHLKRSFKNLEYWGQVWPGRSTHFPVCYSDQRSHLTRERNCCHLEWRFHGCAAVAKLGVFGPAGLIGFDFAQFWRKHLDLRDLDLARAGRDQRNRETGQRRRSYYPSDADVGRRLFTTCGSTACSGPRHPPPARMRPVSAQLPTRLRPGRPPLPSPRTRAVVKPTPPVSLPLTLSLTTTSDINQPFLPGTSTSFPCWHSLIQSRGPPSHA